ncbi:phosphatidate cytidylyltransferase [Bhargavaea cecembensis]|uniref:phosphatidate cytidylyltransferase n=1 Tax=Bhargavaea cecembensis TaxID=394098 RepID=UPI00058EFE70|nr:phosphatidate cytidylyltransferase [Bhargavaea cecembensis]
MKTRIITAVVAGLLFVPLVLIGGLPFTLLVFAMAAVGMYELLRMKHIPIVSVPGVLAILALFSFMLKPQWADAVTSFTGFTKIEVVYAIVLLLLIYTVVVKNRFTFEHAAFTVLAMLYLGIGFYYLIITRDAGIEYIIYALIVVWLTDTGAYFTGRSFGKRKLWPEISPNKTVEGFIGGIIAAVAAACLFQVFMPVTDSYLILIVVTIIASVTGQIGDLVESALKRYYGVKDSGKILPGHGGILDRFDSLLFVLPLLNLLHFVG